MSKGNKEELPKEYIENGWTKKQIVIMNLKRRLNDANKNFNERLQPR